MVVDVRSAVGAVIAVHGFAGIASVVVGLDLALGDVEVRLGDQGVQREGTA